MRVLSVGTDRKLFEEGSTARARHEAYAQQLGTLDIIVFTRGNERPVRVGALSVTPTNSFSRLFYGLNAFSIARKLSRPDVITAQDPFETGLIAWFIARRLHVPLHVQVHTDFTSREFARASLFNRLRVICAWFVLRRAVRIRVILERTKKELGARGISAPITLLPIFVDTERFARIPHTKHPRFKESLLAIGRLASEKRFSLVIRALHSMRTAGHDAGLTLVGAGSEEKRLRALAQKLGLESFVEFTGWHNDITPYLSHADILLVPSRFEGYGMVIVEALAAGVPVLSTDVGVAREAGAIVTTPEKFADALQQWFARGPRTAELKNYPYKSFDEYVKAYGDDLAATR
jgi:glycosyltransferase involved in cell wall biosynthesis